MLQAGLANGAYVGRLSMGTLDYDSGHKYTEYLPLQLVISIYLHHQGIWRGEALPGQDLGIAEYLGLIPMSYSVSH